MALSMVAAAQPGIPKSAQPSASDRKLILAVLDRVVQAEAGKDLVAFRAEGWPGAKFSVRGNGEPLDKAGRRAWQDPIFSIGPISQRVRLLKPQIAVTGRTAHVLVRAKGWDLHIDYNGEFAPSGERFTEMNDVVLEKRGAQWRVLSWDRDVRRISSKSRVD